MESPTSDDLKSVQTLCEDAADASLDLLIGLGPRPSDPDAATTWDTQDALLKNKISTLTNLASSLGAAIVVKALQDVWPSLEELDDVTSAARGQIAKIADINKALTAVASVINFAAAAITIVTQPSPGNAGKLLTAFNGVKGQLA
jgi:hypothetical protein